MTLTIYATVYKDNKQLNLNTFSDVVEAMHDGSSAVHYRPDDATGWIYGSHKQLNVVRKTHPTARVAVPTLVQNADQLHLEGDIETMSVAALDRYINTCLAPHANIGAYSDTLAINALGDTRILAGDFLSTVHAKRFAAFLLGAKAPEHWKFKADEGDTVRLNFDKSESDYWAFASVKALQKFFPYAWERMNVEH